MAKKHLLRLVLGVVVLWICTVPVLMLFADEIGERGQIGDAFGAVNALFSGLAFVGLVVAILQQNEARDQQAKMIEQNAHALALQRRELDAQITELKETRAEMKRQADAAVKSEETMEKLRRATLLSAAAAAAGVRSDAAVREYDAYRHSGHRPPDRREPTKRASEVLFALLALELDTNVKELEEE